MIRPITQQDVDFIVSNLSKMLPDEIAQEIGLSENLVKKVRNSLVDGVRKEAAHSTVPNIQRKTEEYIEEFLGHEDRNILDMILDQYADNGPWDGHCYECPAWDDGVTKCQITGNTIMCPRQKGKRITRDCTDYDWAKFSIENI